MNMVQVEQNNLGKWGVGEKLFMQSDHFVDARSLQLECARVLHEDLSLPV